jgi:prolyl-tRNA synthetase
MRGVPLRLEIGPKDVEKNGAALARRDIPGKEGKQFIAQDGLVETVKTVLDEIQANLLQQATEFRDANIHDVDNYDAFQQVIESGAWARCWWREDDDNENRIKDETGATLRCIPFDQPDGNGDCMFTGEPAERVALFGKAY